MKVIIAGGGLGGLLLAHKLINEGKDRNIEVVVLERDAGRDARGQGIVIGLHQQGVDCMIKTGLGHVLEELMNEDGPRHVSLRAYNGVRVIYGRNWLFVKHADGKRTGSLLPRAQLRDELARLLPDGVIKWDARVTSVEQKGDKVLVTLHNGEVMEGNLLIGADGARSAVRQKIFPNLIPDGLNLWNCWGTIPESRFADLGPNNSLLEDAKGSLTRTSGFGGCSMLAFVYYPKGAPKDARTLFWSLSLPRRLVPGMVEDETIEQEGIRKILLNITKANFVDSTVTRLIETSESLNRGYEMTSVNPAVYKKGSVCPPEHSSMFVTLLGDAAHKTTTQAGVGATAAFLDALDIGDVILQKGNSLTARDVRDYEKRMCDRATKFVGAAYGNTMMIHVERGRIGSLVSLGFVWTIGCIISTVGLASALVKGEL